MKQRAFWTLVCVCLLAACGSSHKPDESEPLSATALGLGPVTLEAGSSTAGGYDFSAGVYTGLSGGDFYFSQGQFWANNVGQRGVIKIGVCSSVDAVTTMPSTGYTRFGVPAVSGNCYVALTHNDERDYIVFRVDSLSATTASLTWKLVATGNWGATLTAGSPSSGGYDFSARLYTGLSAGDFYFTDQGFWANNTGQRGVVKIGPCNVVDDILKAPETGYTIAGVPAVEGNCYAALTHNEEHDTILFRVDTLSSVTASLTWKLVDYCYGYSDPRQSVNCWLTKNSTVAKYVIWENRTSLGKASAVAWPNWKNVQRDTLRDNVRNYTSMLANGTSQDPDPLVDPPVNQEALQDGAFPVGVLGLNDTWRLYVKTVAMSLAVELSRYVPWSVTSYNGRNLASLFDSRHLLSYTWSGRASNLGVPTPQAEGYILVSNNYDSATHSTFSPYVSYVTPAPPYKALQFIRNKALLGTTRLQTITNAVDWTRRLRHYFGGGQTTDTFQATWQYRGPAPVSRTVDTTVSGLSSDSNAYHYTAGCHGTSSFLASVLRTVNIPVDNNVVAAGSAHSVTRFMTENVYLSHGDDPYIAGDIYGIPASALLIPSATYSAWFVNATQTLISQDVGRGNPEAKIKYLSGQLQWLYCNDPVPGADHANSLVMRLNDFAIRPDVYPLSYLENLPPDPSNPSLPPSLWDRLGQKVAAQGGCQSTLNTIGQQMTACFAVLPVSERLDCNW